MTFKPDCVGARAFSLFLALSLTVGNAALWADDAPPAPPAASFTPAQLDSLVAPIALYPDPLLSQILVASTYPLEIVQAGQWIEKHSNLQGAELTQAAQGENWDPSVQALVVFPDVLKRLNQDITWTTRLGNAFLADQAAEMDAVQRMRVKAEASGKLASTDQEKVITTNNNGQTVVEIQPANPNVIYVPVYNPDWIWGPSEYYPYPYWDYPAAPPVGAWWFWGPEITIGVGFGGFFGWGDWGWGPRWRDHRVFVNDAFVHRYHFNEVPGHGIGGPRAWAHEPAHRMGVAYPNRAISQRYRGEVRPHPSVGAVQERFNVLRSRGPAATEHIGRHEVQPEVYNHNRSAFGGAGAGPAVRTYSNRGHSSLAPVGGRTPSVQPRGGGPSSSGGGNRGGESRGSGNRGGGHNERGNGGRR